MHREKHSYAVALRMCADIPPEIYIMLAKLAILLTVELFCICCIITLMAIGNLEVATDNLGLSLSHRIILIDKTARKGESSSHFKGQE